MLSRRGRKDAIRMPFACRGISIWFPRGGRYLLPFPPQHYPPPFSFTLSHSTDPLHIPTPSPFSNTLTAQPPKQASSTLIKLQQLQQPYWILSLCRSSFPNAKRTKSAGTSDINAHPGDEYS